MRFIKISEEDKKINKEVDLVFRRVHRIKRIKYKKRFKKWLSSQVVNN